MRINNFFLFLIPAIIWGSTWFVIKFQLGETHPILSVSYRFGIAGILLLIYCRLKGLRLLFDIRSHFFLALQGLLLFGFNYFFVYLSELYLTSGLVAAAFSLLVFLNIFFGFLFLKSEIRKNVMIGALLGLLGTVLIFKPEFSNFDFSDDTFKGLLYCTIGIIFASLGNITSAYNQKKGLPVVSSNAYGMIYGGIITFIVALLMGLEIIFDTTPSYIISLIYLVIFGSIIAFSTYLQLIGKIGADKAAYVIVVVPLIALLISTFFENYKWTIEAVIGTSLILGGNFLSLWKK